MVPFSEKQEFCHSCLGFAFPSRPTGILSMAAFLKPFHSVASESLPNITRGEFPFGLAVKSSRRLQSDCQGWQRGSSTWAIYPINASILQECLHKSPQGVAQFLFGILTVT